MGVSREAAGTAILQRLEERVYRFEDTCNVYAVTSGDRALLIDFGSGAILEHLSTAGVRSVDWVLHTHHHRDQCQGDQRIDRATRIAVSAREAELFERAEEVWSRRAQYDVYQLANEWNSLARSVRVDHRLADYERFRWEDLEVLVLPSPGHTRGSVTFLVAVDRISWAFCGDMIHSPGRLWTLHDLQWDYVEPDALNVALHTVRTLREHAPDRLAPSHGGTTADPVHALDELEANMLSLHRLLARGYREEDEVPAPSSIDARFDVVSEHLVSVLHPVAHFHVLHVDGNALLFDYGFPSWDHAVGAGFRFVQHSLAELRRRFGIEHVEVVVPTHYHDDHVCGFTFLREQFRCEIWAFEAFADILEHPDRYRLPGVWSQPISVDRRIRDGERFEWRGFSFTARHLPGHTHYAGAFFGSVDDLRIGVVGDELELDRSGRLRGSGPVYRNRMLADSFLRGIETIAGEAPDVLLTGHSGAMRTTRDDLASAREWAEQLSARLLVLAAVSDAPGFAFDPDFANVYPYKASAWAGAPAVVEVTLHNHFTRAANGRLEVIPPPGWTVQPAGHDVELGPGVEGRFPFRLAPRRGLQLSEWSVYTVDVTLGGVAFGQVCEGFVRLIQPEDST